MIPAKILAQESRQAQIAGKINVRTARIRARDTLKSMNGKENMLG